MRAIYAIALTTFRASLRSHVVHVLLAFVALAVFVLPLTITGDGTAHGLLQVSLSYTLGLVGMLLSIVAVWLGCTVVADDIERYQIHMIVTKPVPRASIWLGKWLSIVIMQGLILLVAGAAIIGLVLWRLQAKNFDREEMVRLQHEVLVGRRLFEPDKPDLEALVRDEFARRLEMDRVNPAVTEKNVKDEIRRQARARLGEVPAGQTRGWRFRGLPDLQTGQPVSLRYRMYVDRVTSRNQRDTAGIWWLRFPQDGKLYPLPQKVLTGVYHEIPIPPEALFDDGHVEIGYENRDFENKSVIFQLVDGPVLLMPVAGFTANYVRVLLLLFLQIMFVAAIGCTCGAGLSAPVAIFVAFAYLLIGSVVMAMRPSTPEDLIVPKNIILRLMLNIRLATDLIVVSINEFNEIKQLAHGQLIETGRMLYLFLSILALRGLPIALLGMWVLSRRELGIVVRR